MFFFEIITFYNFKFRSKLKGFRTNTTARSMHDTSMQMSSHLDVLCSDSYSCSTICNDAKYE